MFIRHAHDLLSVPHPLKSGCADCDILCGLVTVPEASDTDTITELREVLAARGYDVDHVRAALRAGRDIVSTSTDLPVHLRRVPEDGSLGTLIRLFLLGQTSPAERAAAALAPLPLARLEALGLLGDAADGVTARVRIVPHGRLLITCDRNPDLDPGPPDPAYVTGLNGPAVLLARMTVRRGVANALDVGTGNGIQALLAAAHCERVTAVDINPRAIAYARFNAELNGCHNLEFEVGDLFEPVRGRRFDLVTCNPPYVISPDHAFTYRDSGELTDSLCRRIVAALPDHLAEGGFGQLLMSWVDPDPILPAADSGCDAWLLHYRTEDPLTHAAKWLRPQNLDGLAGYGDAIDRWLGYYGRNAVEGIAFGALTLRRRSGAANWTRLDELRAGENSASAQVLRVFAAQDFLAANPDPEALLDRRLALVPEHRLDQSLHARDGEWELVSSTLTLTEGVTFSGAIDVGAAQLLGRLDGTRTLRQALAGEQTNAEAAGMARRLLELGFLELR